MEYNDNPQQSDAETIQQSGRSQDTERTSITAAPLSAVLHRLGLRPTTRSDEMQADELLVTALTDEQVAVRTAAIQALVKQGKAIPIEPLLAIVQHDPVWSVRAMAALALRGGGDQVPIAPLLLALHDEDEAVRAAIVRVLGSMGERVPLQALQNALYDASWTVREAAMLTLEELEHRVLATVERASLYPDTSTPPLPLTATEVNFLHHEGHQEIHAHEPEVHGLNQQPQSTHPGESSHNVATPAPRRHHHPFLANRRISRRAVMVGVATVIVAGNSIVWSLLLRGLHDRQKPQQTITGNKPESISFYGPGYSALDAQGNLYVMDQDFQNTRARILKLSPTGKVLTAWHFQTGTQPTFLAIDERGNPYVSVQSTKSVYQLSPTGNLLLKWRLTGAQPTGLAFDKQGNLYVASYGNDTIQKYSSVGKLLATWGGPGTNPGQFYNPTAIVVDAQGYIYVADQSNNRIQKLAPTGTPITTWGTSGNGPEQFLQLGAVTLDAQGNVYTTDGSTDLVQKFSPVGKLLGTWGTTGVGTVQFGTPRGVAVDAQGNIYVSSANDTGATFTNGRITVLSPTGKVLAIWR